MSDEKFSDGGLEAGVCAFHFMIASAEAYFHSRNGHVIEESDVLKLIRDAEKVGIVSETGMRNSGMMKNGMGMAIDHLIKRSVRAFNIARNPKGYTAPSRPLYGDNDGIPAPRL